MQDKNIPNGIFSLRLLEVMKKKGLTQRDVADLANITQAAVSRYLRDESSPRAAELSQLSQSLGVSMDWLWGNTVDDTELYQNDSHWENRAIKAEEKLKMLKAAMTGWLKKI